MTPPSRPREARRRFAAALEQQLSHAQLHEGEQWYLVSCLWWTRVLGAPPRDDDDDDDDGETAPCARTECDAPVTNAVLLEVDLSSRPRHVAVLRPMLVENTHFRLVNTHVWQQLVDQFGCDWAIARPVIARGAAATTCVVDVHLMAFEVLVWHSGLAEPVELVDSEQKAVILLVSKTCSLHNLQLQIWQSAELELRKLFPNVTEKTVRQVLQVCYRLRESSPWMRLSDAVDREDDKKASSGFTGTTGPDMLVKNATVADLQLEPRDYKPGKEKLHYLLVEGRFTATEESEGSDWRHGRFYSEIKADEWRFALEKNQLIDALDTDHKWYESRVVDLDPVSVQVHFRGWTAKWDEWIKRTSTRIAPLHTKVPNWRDFQVGDEILVGREVATKTYPEWSITHVIDRQQVTHDGSLRIRINVDGTRRWIDAQDELLCPVGTHPAVNASAVGKPCAPSFSPASSVSRYGQDYDADRGRPEFEGVVGLSNLGNTCFMNSMLQCLINTPPLRQYFLMKDPVTGRPFFTKEINRDNPLGMKGIMAVDFASLLRKMWSNEFKIVTPTKLKSVIGQYAPQFAGYQQHDSQELMNFLLDGLHEDLNRVKSKPYTEPVEGKGRSDLEVAQEEWKQFLRRNDSIIVDNFMGQLRSHVTCSNVACGNESVTFDPYMSLSVPITTNETLTVEVQLFWANGDIPMKYAVRLPKDGCSLRDAKVKLSELSCIHISRIIFVEVWNHRILKAYSDKMCIDRLRDGVLHAYELELPMAEYSFSSPAIRPLHGQQRLGTMESEPVPAKQMHLVELLHLAPVASPVNGQTSANGKRGEDRYGLKQRRVEVELFNTPLLVSIGQKWTKAEIHRKVWQIVHRLVATKRSGSDSGADFGCRRDQQLPYRLHVTDPNGAITFMSDLSRDDEVVDVPDSTSTPFRFTLEWKRDGYQRGYDETSAKRIALHQSMANLKLSPGAGPITLLSCLTKFTEREQLGEANTWYCPKCKQHVRAFKKFDLFSLPKVLIFHLKRFRYAQNSFYLHRDKISTLVEFPVEGLDLSEFVVGPQNGSKPIYDLYAVSEHVGGLGGGHYTAVAKNPENKYWFNFNDSHTSPTSAENAVSARAYVLFYIRRDQV
ncbi:unnamed protein product [Hyaloperonospora brassicae]|uniref:Ubiquitinyl hydrolase 1 n=1 Tax=Hyaloperonospora brassicae TaxID=162125 RepID=A0AAV0T2F8_HYABA|nr:unnamed protein product [Hyaloperonospora brassicae]